MPIHWQDMSHKNKEATANKVQRIQQELGIRPGRGWAPALILESLVAQAASG